MNYMKKKSEQFLNEWLSEEEKVQNKKKLDEYIQKMNKYKKLIEENITFPTVQGQLATIKNKYFNEIEILNFFKLINDEKKE